MSKQRIAYLLPDPPITAKDAECQRLMDDTLRELMDGALRHVTPAQIEELRKPGKRLSIETGYEALPDGGYQMWATPVVKDIEPLVGCDDD